MNWQDRRTIRLQEVGIWEIAMASHLSEYEFHHLLTWGESYPKQEQLYYLEINAWIGIALETSFIRCIAILWRGRKYSASLCRLTITRLHFVHHRRKPIYQEEQTWFPAVVATKRCVLLSTGSTQKENSKYHIDLAWLYYFLLCRLWYAYYKFKMDKLKCKIFSISQLHLEPERGLYQRSNTSILGEYLKAREARLASVWFSSFLFDRFSGHRTSW